MRKKVDTLIVGAGAGGLGAACWLKKYAADFMVVEGAKELPKNMQNGVHYLHSIPELPFETNLKKITLTDGILETEGMQTNIISKPSLKHALDYSEKVREIQHPSSIMEIGKEDSVFMPKSNSMNELMKEMYDYSGEDKFVFGKCLNVVDTEKHIAFFRDKETDEEFVVEYKNLISTIPLDKFRVLVKNEFVNSLELKCVPVFIANYCVEKIVPNWMINLYIPDKNFPIYRASILNGICSVESTRELRESEMWQARDLLSMFHIVDCAPEKFTWWTGKVVSISTDDRVKLIEEMKKLDIYLVGRFARWDRKLLVDTTINQAKEVVNEIMK